MSVDVGAMTDYSFEEIMKAAKSAIITGLMTQNVSVGGKTITFGSVAEARATYLWAREMSQADSGNGGGFVKLWAN